MAKDLDGWTYFGEDKGTSLLLAKKWCKQICYCPDNGTDLVANLKGEVLPNVSAITKNTLLNFIELNLFSQRVWMERLPRKGDGEPSCNSVHGRPRGSFLRNTEKQAASRAWDSFRIRRGNFHRETRGMLPNKNCSNLHCFIFFLYLLLHRLKHCPTLILKHYIFACTLILLVAESSSVICPKLGFHYFAEALNIPLFCSGSFVLFNLGSSILWIPTYLDAFKWQLAECIFNAVFSTFLQ